MWISVKWPYLNAQETSPENDMTETLSPNPIQFLVHEEDTGPLGSIANAIPHEL